MHLPVIVGYATVENTTPWNGEVQQQVHSNEHKKDGGSIFHFLTHHAPPNVSRDGEWIAIANNVIFAANSTTANEKPKLSAFVTSFMAFSLLQGCQVKRLR